MKKKLSLLYCLSLPLLFNFFGLLVVVLTESKSKKGNEKSTVEYEQKVNDEVMDTHFIDTMEAKLADDDNPCRNLFLLAVLLNEGKKGTNITEEKIKKMIEEEVLSFDKLPDIVKKLFETNSDLAYKSYSMLIKFDIDFMANILNDTEDDKFYRWKDLEQYHAIYSMVYNYIEGKELVS